MGTQSTWEERQYHETKKSTNLASPTDVLFPAGQDGAWRVVSRNGNRMQGERREATHRDRGGHAPLGRQGRKGGWPIGVNKMCKQNSECKAWHVKASPSSSRDRCTLFRDSGRKKAGKFHLWGEKQDC